MVLCLQDTGIRGSAEDSGRDVDLSNSEPSSMSSSRLLPILRTDAGAISPFYSS